MASTSLVTRALEARAVGGRPWSTWTTLSVEAGARGLPRTDIPAVVVSRQAFRLRPQAGQGVVELLLPDAKAIAMKAVGDGRSLRIQQDGARLLVERPQGSSLTIEAAFASRADGPVRFQVDRVLIDDLAARVVGGADVVPPPPHFRTGEAQPDIAEHVLRYDERGWETTAASLPRRGDDYAHSLDETLQTHFEGPRDAAFTATATYTGRVNGHAAEGPVAEARRSLKAFTQAVGINVVHAMEALR